MGNTKLKEELEMWKEALTIDNIDILSLHFSDNGVFQDMKDWATMGEHKEMIKLLEEDSSTIKNTIENVLK